MSFRCKGVMSEKFLRNPDLNDRAEITLMKKGIGEPRKLRLPLRSGGFCFLRTGHAPVSAPLCFHHNVKNCIKGSQH